MIASWETACRFLKRFNQVKITIPVNGFMCSKAYKIASVEFKDDTLKLVFIKPTKNGSATQNGERLDRGFEGVEQATQCWDVVRANERHKGTR